MFQLNLNPSHATQTLQNTLELNCKKKTCRWKQGQAAQEARGPTAQACRDAIRKINTQTELKLVRNVKGNKGFISTAPTKGRPKTERAHC